MGRLLFVPEGHPSLVRTVERRVAPRADRVRIGKLLERRERRPGPIGCVFARCRRRDPFQRRAAAVGPRGPGVMVVIFCGINCLSGGVAEIDRTSKIRGYVGASIEPGATYEAMYSDDRRLYPLYARCQELWGVASAQ